MLIGCFGLSAVAAPREFNNKEVRQLSSIQKQANANKMPAAKMQVIEMKKNTTGISTRAGGDITSLEGSWTFTLGDYYFQSSTLSSIVVEFEASVIGSDQIMFEDPTNYELPFIGTYDSTTSTLTFTRTYLGTTSQYYIYQAPFEYNYTTQELDPIDVVATYNETAGTLTFKADNGIAWEACTNQAGTNRAGYFSIYDLEAASKMAEMEDDSANWIDLGDATFMDGWVLTAFGLDQTAEENLWKVPLQQNAVEDNVYRLVDPYHCGPFANGGELAQLNTSSTQGYIVFDVTDPDHVVFLKSNAGFANPSAGITQFYCYNTLGYLVASNAGFEASDIVGILGDDILYTTFKNDVVTLGTRMGEDGLENDANFGIQTKPTGGYGWQDQSGNSIDMSAAIYFPNVNPSAIEKLETEIGTVEYYNLQGVKVNNPQKGQMLVKKTGSKAQKVVF